MEEKMDVRLPARYLSAGRCVLPGGRACPDRTPGSALLIVAERGRIGFRSAGGEYVLEDGQALLIPADGAHAGLRLDGEAGSVYCWAQFLDGEGEGRRIRLDTAPSPATGTARDRRVFTFHQLLHAGAQDPYGAMVRDHTLSLLLLALRPERAGTPGNAAAARMFEYIGLHCYDRLTLRGLADELGYSEDYLSHLFRENADCSFREYIHRLRLDRARKELLCSARTIQEIAVSCGYGNARFFSTVFLKHEGITPSAYRNLFSEIRRNDD